VRVFHSIRLQVNVTKQCFRVDGTPVASPTPTFHASARVILIISQILSLLCLPVAGAETVPENLPAPAIENAELISALTFPSSGEFFAALAKAGRPNLSASGRVPVPMSISERPRIALVVGLLLADGYLAVENQNSQEMKNIGRDLIEMAKKLNAGEHVVSRGRSITDFAENNDWNSLREELEATRNEIRISLTAQKDPGLSLMVSMGAWLRSIHAGAVVVSRQYGEDAASLFRQAALVSAWQRRTAILPARFLADPWVDFILNRIEGISSLIGDPGGDTGPPTEAQIAELEAQTGFIISRLVETPPGESPQQEPTPADETEPAPTPAELPEEVEKTNEVEALPSPVEESQP
jgi:hypothetical protein